ncbi:hypothetical protein [Clostridium sp. CCUG 7971]|uniref:hypothetical protein n=1 Tax=Clostridium sp. CCUG 7971 TaxID=2811414 RepID=UPI001ABACAC8|nr:hypothetical protein [Clostridium sp. CCUG 7971]MBO3446348.1 hypothetical protein [Clostridium sp. CCUG 7971]
MNKKPSKALIIILSTIALLVIAIVSDIGLNKLYKTKYEEFDSVDKEMFIQLSSIYKQFNENSDELWNDKYKLNEKPIVLIRTNKDKGIIRKYAYAVNIKGIEKSVLAKK